MANKLLASIKRRLDNTEGGSPAKQSLENHYKHLEQLSANLRQLGMDEKLIDEHVMLIFQQYERELINYIEETGDRIIKNSRKRIRQDKEAINDG